MADRTLADLLRSATAELRAAGLPDAARDARRLVAHAAGLRPDRLTLHLPDVVAPGVAERLGDMLRARAARRPVAQIIGARTFWGRDFAVTEDVLDPRPETETLVAEALAAPFDRLLDLGTGSGVLAVTLLAERPGARAVATDISAPALAVADRNAEAHGVSGRLTLLTSDWWSNVEGEFDLILSNPPYIAADQMADLAPDVRDHEPWAALTDGGDGLSAYRTIAAGASAYLRPGGRLMVEVGAGDGGAQADAVAALFATAGLAAVASHADIEGRKRVVSASLRGNMHP